MNQQIGFQKNQSTNLQTTQSMSQQSRQPSVIANKLAAENLIPERIKKAHARALSFANAYLNAESGLISAFQELDQARGYLHYGASSLTAYGIEVLKLSESAVVNIISVARKSLEIPALKAAVEDGEMTISKARRIAPVITTENQNTWLELAKTSTSRVIEKEVARANPQLAVVEKLKYKTADRLELTLGVSERLSEKLKRAKDLLAQMRSRAISSEEAFEAALDVLIEKHDPIKKAERAKARREKLQSSGARAGEKFASQSGRKHGPGHVHDLWMSIGKDGELYKSTQQEISGTENKMRSEFGRSALPAVVKHAVTLRDLRQCTHISVYGKRCRHTKWLDVHHIVPVGRGGSNEIANLTTLCSAHHGLLHQH